MSAAQGASSGAKRRPRTPRAARIVRERQEQAAARLALARSWLVREGYLEHTTAGEYQLTDTGRDWLLWALWEHAGAPGLPATAYDESEAS